MLLHMCCVYSTFTRVSKTHCVLLHFINDFSRHQECQWLTHPLVSQHMMCVNSILQISYLFDFECQRDETV